MTTTTTETEVTILDIPSAITRLQALLPGHQVLSVYVDTSPARMRGQAYLLSYRDACRDMRRDLPADQVDSFEAAAARVERYLVQEFTPHRRALALFAVVDELIVVPLPESSLEHVTWDERAEIGPLEAMLDEHERIAVVLFDKERTRLYTVFLGAIESQQTFEDEIPGKQATGGWFGLQQTRFERHREDHLHRHARRTAQALMTVLRTRSFDRLLLAGPDEALAVLRRDLPRPLQARLAGKLDLELFATDAEVLEKSVSAAEVIERQYEERLVEELLDATATPHVTVGLAGTLDALAEGRVHLLVVSDSFAGQGASCATCSRLVMDRHVCPACGADTTPVASLREAVVQQALAQGAKVETVSEAAAARLDQYGGIAAWTRF